MSADTDVIVIGAGLNGLVAGALLARRKLSTIILDRRPTAGGAATTTEIAPGFRVPGLSHALGPINRGVIRALRLDRAKLDLVTPDPALTALGHDDRPIVFHRDSVLTAASIDRRSPRDAARWRDFVKTAQRVAGLFADINARPAPAIDDLEPRDVWRLIGLGRRARRLGPRDLARAARWTPMPVADLIAEWFDDDLLSAAIAAHAVFGNFVGPWSAGTGGMLLQRIADDPLPVGSGVTVRGGPGALADALVGIATKAGAVVRTNARVVRILTKDGRATGVVLENGDELMAKAVVSAVDPKQTFTSLVDPIALPPSFLQRMRQFRTRGVTSKINVALDAAPVFAALGGDAVPLRGRFVIAPDVDYIERAFDAAKYGELSPAPWLEISIPSMADQTLAPPDKHVMSIYAHFTPRVLRSGLWADRKTDLYRTVMRVLEPHAPGLEQIVTARQVITPEDLEIDWGLSGGHIFHGEPGLDQSWIARPLLGWAQNRTPIDRLYLAGAGTHPGGGLTGMSGFLAARAIKL